MRLRLAVLLVLVFTCIHAQEHWVPPGQRRNCWPGRRRRRRRPAPPAAAQTAGARGFNNQTVRMIVRTSIGGRRLRVNLSNAFGASRWPLARRISPFAPRIPKSSRGSTGRFLST